MKVAIAPTTSAHAHVRHAARPRAHIHKLPSILKRSFIIFTQLDTERNAFSVTSFLDGHKKKYIIHFNKHMNIYKKTNAIFSYLFSIIVIRRYRCKWMYMCARVYMLEVFRIVTDAR